MNKKLPISPEEEIISKALQNKNYIVHGEARDTTIVGFPSAYSESFYLSKKDPNQWSEFENISYCRTVVYDADYNKTFTYEFLVRRAGDKTAKTQTRIGADYITDKTYNRLLRRALRTYRRERWSNFFSHIFSR